MVSASPLPSARNGPGSSSSATAAASSRPAGPVTGAPNSAAGPQPAFVVAGEGPGAVARGSTGPSAARRA
ncbi:hypothetical protein MF672_002010 [Actinomadura sp. ATCC 31491]|uniref:Uncharacterized protein n=1 Tax=Actinomadura luzonensis TaxID=2805427 RepID=A0ABT0FKJ5_9ACTN|nr:hypothetical protein [Actinomadura luzonensis]